MKKVILASAGILALSIAGAHAFPGSASEADEARAKSVTQSAVGVRVHQGRSGPDKSVNVRFSDYTKRTAQRTASAPVHERRSGPDRQVLGN